MNKITKRALLVLLGLLVFCGSFLGVVKLIALLPRICFFPGLLLAVCIYIFSFAVLANKGIDYTFEE